MIPRWCGVFLGVWVGVPSGFLGAEENAVSAEERLTEEEEEAPEVERVVPSGDVRLRLREVRPPGATYDSAPGPLRHDLYFLSRVRWRRGPVAAGAMAKRAAVGPALSYDNLNRYGTFKAAVEWNQGSLAAVAGNYALCFGQGLLFYDGFGEVVRPIAVRERAPASDFSSAPRDGFRGAALRWHPEGWAIDVFGSEKTHALSLGADGRVNENIDDFHETGGDIQTESAYENPRSVTERLAGARLGQGRAGDFRWGATAARLTYNRPFNPENDQFADARAFRGDRLALWGADVEIPWGDGRLLGEAAASRPGGDGGRGKNGFGTVWVLLQKGPRVQRWLSWFDYDADFVTPHGKGLALAVAGGPESRPRNQTGVTGGGEIHAARWKARANAVVARFPESRGNGTDSGPLTASSGRYAFLDQEWKVLPDTEGRLWLSDAREEKREEDAGGFSRTVPVGVRRARGELRWKASPFWTWGLRGDLREERREGTVFRGRMTVWEAIHRPSDRAFFRARVYFFNAREVDLSTGLEEIWPGVVYPRLAGNTGDLRGAPGTRWVLWWARRETKTGGWWVKTDWTDRPAGADGAGDRRWAWHFQWDERWGGK